MGGLVDWREWSDEAFADARAQDKLVLLDIGAVWCHWCHVMDDGIPGDPVHRGTYSDPEVLELINEHFIPIKVDNDRRPDINARYNMGGWPTTAFLTPDGDILYGRTYVPPAEMRDLLEYISGLYQTERDQIEQQTIQMRGAKAQPDPDEAHGDLDPSIVSNVLETIKRSFDFVYGGFGKEPKFPHPSTLALVVEQYAAAGDVELKTIAEKTLRGMDSGGMYDQFAGGFFRYSTTRDWRIPHFEKMLEDNAKLTPVYALASVVLGDERSMDTVRSAHRWLLTDMMDESTHTFAGSQDADEEERYYGKSLDIRATMPTPYIDRTIYTNWNGLMVSALVARYRITSEVEMLEHAHRTFAFLTEKMTVSQPDGMRLFHYYVDGRAQGGPGLIGDQVDYLAAGLDLYEATADESYLAAAVASATYLRQHLEDKETGGFFDLAPSPTAIGELASPKKDMNENADVALALVRLAAYTGDSAYRASAIAALKTFAGSYQRYGYFAAQYARAVDAVLCPALHIVIVGALDRADTLDLQRAAWSTVASGKTVETFDPSSRQTPYPASTDGSALAYVCVGETCQAPVSTAEDLGRLIREVSHNDDGQS